ncbi:MAG TPA: hypothetical protein VIF09_21425 [Polyangiaceae bacterium]
MRVFLAATGVASLVVFFACGGAQPPPAQLQGLASDPLSTPADSAAVNLTPAPGPSGSAGAPTGGAAATPPSTPGGVSILARDQHAPNAVALGKAHVYWVDELDGDIARVTKTGGTTMQVYAGTGQPFSANSSIATDDTDIYWTSQIDKTSSLTRQDRNGGKPTVVTSSSQFAIQCVAVDETAMYWVLGGGVIKQNKHGGAPQALAGGFKGADCIAVDGDHVYWSVSGSPDKQFADGAIIESTKTGANTRVLVKDAAHAENVHADGESVYWMSGPKVLRADKKTGETKKLAEASGPVADIAIDDHYVYFLTPDALARAPKDGSGHGETLADGLSRPTSVIADATAVYFTTKGTEAGKWHDGTVGRWEKH